MYEWESWLVLECQSKWDDKFREFIFSITTFRLSFCLSCRSIYFRRFYLWQSATEINVLKINRMDGRAEYPVRSNLLTFSIRYCIVFYFCRGRFSVQPQVRRVSEWSHTDDGFKCVCSVWNVVDKQLTHTRIHRVNYTAASVNVVTTENYKHHRCGAAYAYCYRSISCNACTHVQQCCCRWCADDDDMESPDDAKQQTHNLFLL